MPVVCVTLTGVEGSTQGSAPPEGGGKEQQQGEDLQPATDPKAVTMSTPVTTTPSERVRYEKMYRK